MAEQEMSQDVTAAREFVSQYVPDPGIVESMEDDTLLEYQSRLNENISTIRSSAVEEFKTANPPTDTDWRKASAAAVAGKEEGEAYEKELKRLERFSTPQDVYKFGRSLETKLSGGEYIRKPPPGADDKEMDAYRKEMGVPDTYEDYYKSFGDLQIGDNDKPIFDDFLENVAQKVGLAPDAATEVVKWYYDLQKTQQEILMEEDAEKEREVEDFLRSDKGWGGDFRANSNAIENLLARMPTETKEMFLNARFPDGSAQINSPHMRMWLAQMEREINPASTFVPAGVTNDLRGLKERFNEIDTILKTDRKRYNSDQAMQDEYVKLIDSIEKMEAREK